MNIRGFKGGLFADMNKAQSWVVGPGCILLCVVVVVAIVARVLETLGKVLKWSWMVSIMTTVITGVIYAALAIVLIGGALYLIAGVKGKDSGPF